MCVVDVGGAWNVVLLIYLLSVFVVDVGEPWNVVLLLLVYSVWC